MNIKCIKVGELETNCYILNIDNEFVIIDPGADFEKINSNIYGKVVAILITHHHFDHIGVLSDCMKYYNVDVYDYYNLKEGRNIISKFDFIVSYNLGHTMDSISFIFDNIMFSGDFIFNNSIGRTDLRGNYQLMVQSIRSILNCDKNYIIYPGHGDFTYLDNERSMLKLYLN